jgi:hypothetical protein
MLRIGPIKISAGDKSMPMVGKGCFFEKRENGSEVPSKYLRMISRKKHRHFPDCCGRIPGFAEEEINDVTPSLVSMYQPRVRGDLPAEQDHLSV